MSAKILEFRRKDPNWHELYTNMPKIDLMMEMANFTQILAQRGILTQKLTERGVELYAALHIVSSTPEFKHMTLSRLKELQQELETNKVAKHLPKE